MALNYSSLIYNYYIFLLIFTIPLFSSPVFSLPTHQNPSDHTRGVLCEEKTRLGSTPPSCYNKCNQCHPCTAIQVSTLPSFDRIDPTQTSQPANSGAMFEYESSSGDNNRYSNYKPLGWKCRCRDHFYNP
ncbi:hypothetical protein BVRB_6g134850 isoform A [Beta vulgaris subsp. vulgaris]|uniref:EPIDERMAL PATTERNING FACTOR-like protein 1 n=1 Tax=Beta vulgaris subsp. vulgaris TaxID=3555 RepID=UPI00065C4A42|nr:EPIDERMAL PATTERNING FACTOR-like protein 1 [Beta vulgaris subsp. vulgaris]KMT08760.1 hypothetical protein BVRB_6g134850 isoform A [Beta vulgaris subsp. vulgaris]